MSDTNKRKGIIKDVKIKGLLPTLREKKRFVVFQIEVLDQNRKNYKFNFDNLSKSLFNSLVKFLGTINLGKSGFWLVKDNYFKDKNSGLIKVSTKYKDNLIGALSLVENIDNVKVKVNVLGVSGTIKGAGRFFK